MCLQRPIEPDHLGTPRRVVSAERDRAVWSWDLQGPAFGTHAPDEDPDGDGGLFTLDLRFPGQQYDAATGLHYNYFRDYDPATGRYVESDPIGLRGGVNTYLYVGGSPIQSSDFYGLARPVSGAIRNVPCNGTEAKECRELCAAHGKQMESCKRVEKWKMTRAYSPDGGPHLESFGWIKINVSCSCTEGSYCERNPATCVLGAAAVIIEICLAPEIVGPAVAL